MTYTTPSLKTITGNNKYCGPAAVAAVTGKTTDVVAGIMRDRRRRRGQSNAGAVRGTWTIDVSNAFSVLGYELKRGRPIYPKEKPTLARWLREREDRTATYLVEVTGHWVIVRGNKLADSIHREPVFIKQAKGRRCRVVRVWLIHKR